MGLNIKNKEAHRLVAELARLTGECMTTAITIAVRERLERLRVEQNLSLTSRLLAIGKEALHVSKSRSARLIMQSSLR